MNISIKALARIGGLLYLINIVFGFFAVGYVPGVINVSGNASASAHNIILHENIYRLALVAHITILITNIPLAVIFYNLFKVLNRRISLLVVLFTMVGTSIEAANLLSPFASLVLLKGKYYSDTFTSEQLSSLSYIFQ